MFAVLVPLLRTVIVVKLTGFVVSAITSPTNHALRKSFLDHVEHVVEGLGKNGIGIGPSDRETLVRDLAVLRIAADKGWTDPSQTAGLGRTMLFLSWAHARGLEAGIASAASSHWIALGDWVWDTGSKALDAILPRQQ